MSAGRALPAKTATPVNVGGTDPDSGRLKVKKTDLFAACPAVNEARGLLTRDCF